MTLRHHRYLDDPAGTLDKYAITITVTDDDGGAGKVTIETEVNNVAPDASASGPESALIGESVTFTLSADDVSPVDQADDFEYDIDWDGDGSVDQTVSGSDEIRITHTFVLGGKTTVVVTATDKDGVAIVTRYSIFY